MAEEVAEGTQKVVELSEQNKVEMFLLAGQFHNNQGMPYEALESFNHAIKIQKKVQIHEKTQEDGVMVMLCLEGIADTLRELGRYKEALESSMLALRIARRIFPRSLKVAAVLNTVGIDSCFVGSYVTALQSHEESLEIKNQLLGGDTLETATSLNNIGYVFETMGKLDEAMEKYQKSLAIRRKGISAASSQDEKIDLAENLMNIGNVFCGKGALNEAVSFHQESIQMKQQLQADGIDSERLGRRLFTALAQSLVGFGNVMESCGRLGDALYHYQNAMKLTIGLVGQDHPECADALFNIGNIYDKLGHTHLALTAFSRSLSINQGAYGMVHANCANGWGKIGCMLHKLGNHAKAAEMLNEAIRILKLEHGDAHYEIADAQYNLGVVLAASGDTLAAKVHFEDSARIYTSFLGEDHAHTLEALTKAGQC